MTNQPELFSKVASLVRHYWIIGLALLLIGLVLLKSVPAWAAPAIRPVNQTVPQPTATKANTPVPQATNTPRPHKDHNNGNNNNNNQQAPTPTPTPSPAPQQSPAGNGPTGVVVADRLNVRQGPGTNFSVVGHVARGDVLHIQQRNAAGTWWQICCASDTKSEGWVSTQFIQPNFDATQANTLLPVGGVTAAAAAAATAPPATQIITPTATASVAPTAVATAATVATAASAITPTTLSNGPLALTIQQTPPMVWQGKKFVISFVITNTGSVQAAHVELRDQLPQELTFVTATAGSGGKVTPQSGIAGAYVFDVQWPQLAAGASVTATITLQMAPKVPDGSVIDNLAVATADQVDSTTSGISIGLPPTSLPDFQ